MSLEDGPPHGRRILIDQSPLRSVPRVGGWQWTGVISEPEMVANKEIKRGNG